MAKTIVALTDTFNSFKNKANDISDDIGDISLLTTTITTDLTLALNGIDAEIGDVSTLTTTGTTLVTAINEHDVEIGNMTLTGLTATDLSAAARELRTELGDTVTLTTYGTNVVSAVNELDAYIGDPSTLVTTDKTSLVAAINEVHNHTTANVSENTNLYYTQARFDTAFGNKDTDDLTEGLNLYYTQARFDTAFGNKDTDDLSEGTSKYYTDARVRAAVSGLNSGTGFGALAYTASTGAFQFTKVTAANIRGSVSISNTGTGFGELSYVNGTGVIGFAKVTAANIRAQFTGGDNVTISALGVITATTVGVDSTGLLDNAVANRHMQNNAVNTLEINDLAVTTAKIDNSAVTTGKIADRTIVGTDINAAADLDVATVTTTGNMDIGGDLIIRGTTTTVDTTNMVISDNILILNNDVVAEPTENSGIAVERGTSDNVSVLWNETTERWTFTNDGTTFYNMPDSSEYDIGDAGSSQNIFKTFAVAGQSSIVADNNNDIMTVVGGDNITVTTNNSTDTLTFSSTNTTDFTVGNSAGTAQFVMEADDTMRFGVGAGMGVAFDDDTNKVTYTNISPNVTTNLSTTPSPTTISINSSDGTNAVIAAATTSNAGIMTKAIFDQHTANNSKVSNTNITHTGEVTGSTSLTITNNAVTKDKMANDAVGFDELTSVVTFVIYNSAGTALKTMYGAGA